MFYENEIVVWLFSRLHVIFQPAGVEVKAICPAWATGTDIKPRVDVEERMMAA